MPWSHCDVAFILDDEVCPKCGSNKDAWTVQIEKTRQLIIGRRKKTKASIDIELRTPKGEPDAGREYRATFANGRVKRGKLDEQGRAHFKQLYPGPVEVVFPEVELDQARPKRPPRRGQRQVLAAPLAEAVKASPPLAGWELQALAASAAKPTPTLAAAQLLTALPLAPPAAEPAESEPAESEPGAEGDPLKAELPLQLTFATRAEAQAWLLRNPIQVHVDGERVAAGSYLRDARSVVVQFRLPPGEHHVLVSSRQGDLRTIYVSRQLELSGPAAEAEGDDPARPPLGRADPAAGPSEQGKGGGFPSEGPSKRPSSELGRGLSQGPARDLGGKGSGEGLGRETLASTGARGPSPDLAPGSGEQLGAASAGRVERGDASANPLTNLVHSEWSGDPIGLTRAQIKRGAGELYVFQPPADTLKAELPLEVTFASRREAQGWLLRNRLQVYADGQPVAHGAHVADPKRILVQFRVEPGDHHVIVSAQAKGLSTVLVSRQLTISDGSGSGAVKPAPPREAPSRQPGRAPLGRATPLASSAKLGSSPAAAPKAAPRLAPKAAPELAPKAAPRLAPKAAPELAPKAAPERAPKAAPKAPETRFPKS